MENKDARGKGGKKDEWGEMKSVDRLIRARILIWIREITLDHEEEENVSLSRDKRLRFVLVDSYNSYKIYTTKAS